MLEYRNLETFATVILEGGFDKAARKLHLTQSAVSQRVRLLEEQHGQILLQRSTPPQPTEAGLPLLYHYRKVKQLEDDLRTATAPTRDGSFNTVAIAVNADTLAIKEMEDQSNVIVGGAITAVDRKTTKKGSQMAILTIEDMYSTVEVVVFPDLFEVVRDFLVAEAMVFVQGRLESSEISTSIQAERVVPLDRAGDAWLPSVHCTIDPAKTDRSALESLNHLFKQHAGAYAAYLHITGPPGKAGTVIALPDTVKLSADAALFDKVHDLLGYNAVQVACRLLPGAEKWSAPKRRSFNGTYNKKRTTS